MPCRRGARLVPMARRSAVQRWALEVRVFGAGTVPLSAYLLPVPHGLVAVGCMLCIGARTRGESMPGITADILLLLLAGIRITQSLAICYLASCALQTELGSRKKACNWHQRGAISIFRSPID